MGQVIIKSYSIKSKSEKIWKCLFIPSEIYLWGGGKAYITDQAGTKFSYWEGEAFGKILEIDKHKKVVLEYFEQGWKTPSKVTIKLFESGSTTSVTLEHVNFPNEFKDAISYNWDRWYFYSIKKHLEEGSLVENI
ncbi:MAG: SRPBCC domain-containing protein [bacterium]